MRAYRARVGDTDVAVRICRSIRRMPASRRRRRGNRHLPDRRRHVHLARAGQSYSLETPCMRRRTTRAAAASDGRLIAPMNGRVVAVNAKAGDTAEAGHALVVLEAMKMEHALSVPQAARIKAVHVAPGAQVAPGQLLVELEPERHERPAARQLGW